MSKQRPRPFTLVLNEEQARLVRSLLERGIRDVLQRKAACISSDSRDVRRIAKFATLLADLDEYVRDTLPEMFEDDFPF